MYYMLHVSIMTVDDVLLIKHLKHDVSRRYNLKKLVKVSGKIVNDVLQTPKITN